jgi:predicted alpha/beta hydrolase
LEIRKIKYNDNTESRVAVFQSMVSNSTTLICLPAMGMRAKYYELFANSLCEKGFNVITADWRGLGHSPIRASRNTDFGYKELIQDIKKLIELSNNWYPNTKKVIVGHSLGGQIGSLLTARFPSMISGLILVTSCSVHYKGWNNWTALKLRFAGTMFNPISRIIGYFPGDKIGFAGKEARTVIKDWSYNARSGEYKPTHSDYDYEKALKLLNKPVMSISIENDYLASRKAVENLYNKFSSESDISHIHLTSEETGISPLNHFTWAKKPEYFIGIIEKWWKEKMDERPVDN